MSFQDDVAKKKEELEKVTRCKLGDLIVEMGPMDQSAMKYAVGWVREGKASKAWLVGILNANGYQIGKTVVSDHLREECACVTSQ